MAEAYTVYCDGPDCLSTQGPHPEDRPFRTWLRMIAREPAEGVTLDFCCWDCAMKYGATRPPMEVIQ